MPALAGDNLERDRILLKHGAGGRAMRRLIAETVLSAFATDPPERAGMLGVSAMDDGGAVRLGDQWLVVTTDSHVIQPIFFPGGDIGRLSIAGTVNDLAMMGATEPLGITCGVVVEEGFAVHQLAVLQHSMAQACAEAGTSIVAGDTKVMRRGELDGIVINTTGVGMTWRPVRDSGARAGDLVIVTGTIG